MRPASPLLDVGSLERERATEDIEGCRKAVWANDGKLMEMNYMHRLAEGKRERRRGVECR